MLPTVYFITFVVQIRFAKSIGVFSLCLFPLLRILFHSHTHFKYEPKRGIEKPLSPPSSL